LGIWWFKSKLLNGVAHSSFIVILGVVLDL